MANHSIVARAFRIAFSLAIAAGLANVPRASVASDGVKIDCIEEDWELIVQEPDTSTQAPQVTCVTSPTANINNIFAMFTLNHRTLPQYSAGGLQLQIWDGESPVTRRSAHKAELLHSNDETIQWTQRMKVGGGQLTFEIVNGTSTTWGSFGDSGQIKLGVYTWLDDLNGYSPTVSQKNSEIGYASNRVTSLILKRVRSYADGDLVGDDATPRVVYVHE